MDLPDVNILVYAFRSDSSHHRVSRDWLEEKLAAGTYFALSPLALSAVVRITTNPRTNSIPSTVADAFAFCQDLMDLPLCRLVEPGAHHWTIFRRLCVDHAITGPRVTDAWFAALAIEHGCDWITMDRDFARFSGLKWRRPGPA